MVIYSQKMAGFLMQKGFVLQGMDKNKDKTNKNIFYFNDSIELKEAMTEFTSK